MELHKVMAQLREASLEFVWPTNCMSCGKAGVLLCEDCIKELPWIDQTHACPSCGAPFGWLCCTECSHNWEVDACVCALSLNALVGRMVVSYKDFSELRLASLMAKLMNCSLDNWAACTSGEGILEELDGICFVPASTRAYKKRGFDHMELVAYELSRLLDVPLIDVLARKSTADQRKLGKQERQHNMENSLVCLGDLSSLRLLLIDDVVTTGATLRSAARLLRVRGAHCVYACAFARTW